MFFILFFLVSHFPHLYALKYILIYFKTSMCRSVYRCLLTEHWIKPSSFF